MHRLFVAIRPPPAIRRQLAALAGGVLDARWQNDDQLHLTIRFIGSVERPVAEDFAATLTGMAASGVRLRLSGIGQFDGRGGDQRGGALWAGVEPRAPLAALHRKVDQLCVRAGLPPDRRAFLPHITLARLPRRIPDETAVADWLSRHAGLTSEPFDVAHLTVYESHLGTEGATYEVVTRWPLVR